MWKFQLSNHSQYNEDHGVFYITKCLVQMRRGGHSFISIFLRITFMLPLFPVTSIVPSLQPVTNKSPLQSTHHTEVPVDSFLESLLVCEKTCSSADSSELVNLPGSSPSALDQELVNEPLELTLVDQAGIPAPFVYLLKSKPAVFEQSRFKTSTKKRINCN